MADDGLGKRVLVVDDEALELGLNADILSGAGFQVVTAMDPAGALAACREAKPDLAVLDFQMAWSSGADLLAQLREIHPGLPVLFVTGVPQNMDPATLGLPNVRLLIKPMTPALLTAAAKAILGIKG